MVTVEHFSRLVADIYESAVTPQHWEAAIRDIHQTLGASHGALLVADAAAGRSVVSCTLPAEAGTSYVEHYHRLDYVLAAVEEGPIGVVRTGSELTDPKRHREFHAEWARPYEGDDGLVVRLIDRPRSVCFLVAALRRSEWFDTPERVKLMSGLVPHLQQALRTQDRLAALSRRSVDLGEALDTVGHGIIIVGSGGLLINLNSAAQCIARAEDGVRIRSGRIIADRADTGLQLQRAIHLALGAEGSKVRSGRSFLCARPSGKRPYVVHVLPLHRGGTDETLTGARALVLIIDPEHQPEPPAALLRRLHGLTKTEAQIALRVSRGADLKQIAEEQSISLATVRTHLQHVFDKTDTHRQAELVRHLVRLCP
jgi:DNA-binding CsgD family transcriptional regulator